MTELYASSTLKHLSPVVTLNGETGPGGGPLGARLNTLFADCVQRECGNGSPPSTPSDL